MNRQLSSRIFVTNHCSSLECPPALNEISYKPGPEERRGLTIKRLLGMKSVISLVPKKGEVLPSNDCLE